MDTAGATSTTSAGVGRAIRLELGQQVDRELIARPFRVDGSRTTPASGGTTTRSSATSGKSVSARCAAKSSPSRSRCGSSSLGASVGELAPTGRTSQEGVRLGVAKVATSTHLATCRSRLSVASFGLSTGSSWRNSSVDHCSRSRPCITGMVIGRTIAPRTLSSGPHVIRRVRPSLISSRSPMRSSTCTSLRRDGTPGWV